MSSFLVFLASIVVSAPAVCSAALEPLPDLHPPASLKTNITSGHVGKPLMSRFPLCDADLGDDLKPASCRNALSNIPRSPGPRTFGERDTGNWDIILPVRYLSEPAVRSTDDGTCAIDININEEALDESDVSTYGQIELAARTIIDECVGDRVPNKGGYVEDLGFEGDLIVGVERYEPHVTCQAASHQSAPSYDSCKEIIDKMPWSTEETMFGTADQPGLEVAIPEQLTSTDGRCSVIIHGASPLLEAATWAGIWADIVAVNELCVRHGKLGKTPVSSGDPDALQISLLGNVPRNNLDILSSLNLTSSELNRLSIVNVSASGSTVSSLNRTGLVTNA